MAKNTVIFPENFTSHIKISKTNPPTIFNGFLVTSFSIIFDKNGKCFKTSKTYSFEVKRNPKTQKT